MKRFLPVVLVLSSILLLFGSCSSLHRQGYRKAAVENYQFTPVFSPDFDKSLYQAEIIFGKNTLSSLAIIKQMPEYKSFRLAFFSEAGLQLFVMEFLHDGNVNVEYISDFLNKKAVVKKLSSDFSLLFVNQTTHQVHKAYAFNGDTSNYILQMKGNGKKDFYYGSNLEEPINIREKGCAYGKTSVVLDKYDNHGPDEIRFEHKILTLKINLTKINYQEWN